MTGPWSTSSHSYTTHDTFAVETVLAPSTAGPGAGRSRTSSSIHGRTEGRPSPYDSITRLRLRPSLYLRHLSGLSVVPSFVHGVCDDRSDTE